MNLSWVEFFHFNRKPIAVAILVLIPTAVYFQNCSPQGRAFLATKGEVTPPPASPFTDKKVVLNTKSFHSKTLTEIDRSANPGILSPDVQMAEATLSPKVRLLAKVNNACASSWCDGSSNLDAITCQAYLQGFKEKLKSSFQIYEVKNPGTLTDQQLQDWAVKSKVDQICLKGISELRVYYQQSFNDTNYANYQKARLDLISFEAGQTYFTSDKLAPVKVGVIDTGIAGDSVELSNVVARTNVSDFDHTPTPLFAGGDQTKPNNWHGTFVAGIIGAVRNNGSGFVGIAPNVALYAYGIGNSAGSMSNREIGNAIQDVVLDQMDVVNMSFGNSAGYYNDDPIIADGLIDGYNANVLFIVAAGNSAQNLDITPSYPAQYSFSFQNVITVGASDTLGSVASFSNRSASYVNIMAPGVGIASTYPSNLALPPPGVWPDNVVVEQGTSFAAPMVTGAAALAIGALRFKNLSPDIGSIRKLITVDGARLRSDLAPYVKNGAFLDISLLGQAVQLLTSAAPISLSEVRQNDSSGKPTIQLTISYDSSQLASVSANSKIGVFDLTSGCNYSAPCLIMSFDYPSPNAKCTLSSCFFTVTLTRDQVVSMMSAKNDPAQKLSLSVAIYHSVTGKNLYGVDASSHIDLRDLPAVNVGSPLMGAITNIRMDMQNFYVQGWVCLPGSERAIKVGLIDSTGVAINSDFAYAYPYMVPHGTPLDIDGDAGDWMTNVDGATRSFQSGVVHSSSYLASGIVVSQLNRGSFLAGMESNPQLVDQCQSLTASHGFELIVPIGKIVSKSLSGQGFKVQAGDSLELTLADDSGVKSFEFPDVVQTATETKFNVSRDATSYQLSGGLCSSSPSPIEVEVSYTSYNFVWAMTGLIPSLNSFPRGLVNDSSLVASVALPLPIETVNHTSSSNMDLKINTDTLLATDTDPFTLAYKQYLSYPPNAGVGGPSFGSGTSDSLLDQFTANVNSHSKFLKIGSGEPVTYFRAQNRMPAGSAWDASLTDYRTSRTGFVGGKSASIPEYWDYYDVGLPFSTNLIGYDLTTHFSDVVNLLRMNYQITTALREAKKYETPLAKNTGILGHSNLSLNWAGACTLGGIRHEFSKAYAISNYVNYAPFFTNGYGGFWVDGSAPKIGTGTTIQAAMQNLPLTLRFFQDGKLILHLESDSGSDFKEIVYNLR